MVLHADSDGSVDVEPCREQAVHLPEQPGSSWGEQFQLGHERSEECGLVGDCDCVYLWVGWVCCGGGGGAHCFCELFITFTLYARFAMIQTSSG